MRFSDLNGELCIFGGGVIYGSNKVAGLTFMGDLDWTSRVV